MAGAMAASLGAMVANLTSGNKKYADVQGRIDEIIPQLEALRDKLLELADADAAAFAPLSKAYGLPKSTPEEQAHKAQVMEAALRTAWRARPLPPPPSRVPASTSSSTPSP